MKSTPDEATTYLRLSRGRLFCMTVLEPLIRIVASLCSLGGRDASGIASALRGAVLGGERGWRIGRNVHFEGPAERIQLGRDVALWGNIAVNVNGPRGALTIGSGSHVDQFSMLYCQGGVNIGRSCAIAAGTIIYSQTNADSAGDRTPVAQQPVHYATVRIGDGCWLGAGCRILPGVTLGDGCHLGAGAVATGDVAPYSVAVGVPAKTIRTR